MLPSSRRTSVLVASVLATALAAPACDKTSADTTPPGTPDAPQTDPTASTADTPDPGEHLASVLAGEHRSADNKARDAHRHPAETLAFFDVRPEHTVVELWPGGGWYTEILAPYVKDAGKLSVTVSDPNGPEGYYGTGQAQKMLQAFEDQKDVLGAVGHVVVPQEISFDEAGKVSKIEILPFELAPEGTVDVVLTFRNSHGWHNRGATETIYGAAFKALKPGGVFGVVQHRAKEGASADETAKTGYLPQAHVIASAEAVGFRLAEKSEVNANAKDTKDYEKGVWTLPPGLAEKDKDRDKYVAIGESDRMTLKFVKPQ